MLIMRKLNIIYEKLFGKTDDKPSMENIMEIQGLKFIFRIVTSVAVIIFIVCTTIIYKTLEFSYDSQNKGKLNGYLAYTYANKINGDIFKIKIYSITYDEENNKSIAENLRLYEDDIQENINNYKMLYNISKEEKNLIGEFIDVDSIYNYKLNKIIDDIEQSKIISKDSINEIIDSGDERIELSEKLVNIANQDAGISNENSRVMKFRVMNTLIINNFTMISLFILMAIIVKKINKRADYYALHNSITGLPNKKNVINTIAKDISKLYKDRFAMLISLDIDNFKAVNDYVGHYLGDKLLKEVGKRLKRVIHIQDYIYHVSGDEFLFLINSICNRNEAEIILNKIHGIFKEPFYIEGKTIDYLTASLGVAIINKDSDDFETLYNYADDAMHEAKRLGKNRYIFYEEEMYSKVYEKTLKKKTIQNGIKNREFKAFYQPKVSKDEKFLGAEALARWMKEDERVIPPSEFIGFAEEEGLIKDIGEVVIFDVCEKIAEWIKKGYRDFRIAINLSAEQLIDEELCDKALNIIKDFRIPFEYIEFEVTESSIIKDFDVAIKNIKKIKSCGIKVSLDDFGTGYSSLNYLKQLKVDNVKIDKLFIDTLVFDDGTKTMVTAIINMCHYFGYEVIAEGVETIEQIECLRGLNCDIFQGYYFGKPMKSEEFEKNFLCL